MYLATKIFYGLRWFVSFYHVQIIRIVLKNDLIEKKKELNTSRLFFLYQITLEA